jgi:hypothetical protein
MICTHCARAAASVSPASALPELLPLPLLPPLLLVLDPEPLPLLDPDPLVDPPELLPLPLVLPLVLPLEPAPDPDPPVELLDPPLVLPPEPLVDPPLPAPDEPDELPVAAPDDDPVPLSHGLVWELPLHAAKAPTTAATITPEATRLIAPPSLHA